MSALDRALVSAAVAVSPSAHRSVRREQWLADVRDARELDLSPTALAFGALTTALFHRRAGHRSTWGNTLTTMPGSVRSTPHAIPTIPVLIALAVASFLAGGVGLGLIQRYDGFASTVPTFLLVSLAVVVVPGLAVAASVMLVPEASLRRRGTGAVVVLAVTALWWTLITSTSAAPLPAAMVLGVIAAVWLAGWLIAQRRPGWTWSLLLLPVVASALVFPLSNSVFAAGLPFSVTATLSTAIDAVPFLVAVVAAVVARRLSTGVHAEAHEVGLAGEHA
ncbi:hypothetical protein [Curtobacterium sp. MCBA15_001]|uniref:hypothetical protein n=1 Tax=Curtobacterium sp. MCBA15_001 TaxID=1898731 RepID=UPI0008DE4927|nr:hypothetical protein [Curtobacterium sp. MCBA15_001]OIH96527.1 hypothetical protein BIU90_16925 [Curtobacterium sp. MCBA15_001]